MVVDRLITLVVGFAEFDSIVLVEVCGIDDHHSNRYVVDRTFGKTESLAVDGGGGYHLDFGYGFGGYDDLFFSRLLGSGVYECRMCGVVLLAQGKGVGGSSHIGCNDHCDGAASVGLGLHTRIDLDVVPDALSRRGMVEVCALGRIVSDSQNILVVAIDAM